MGINIFNKKPEPPKNKVRTTPKEAPAEPVAKKRTAKSVKSKKQEATKGKGIVDRLLSKVFDGEFLTKEVVMKQLPFIGFIGLLLIANIAWVYYFEGTAREIEKIKKEVGEMNSEYQTNMSELESKRRQTQVAKDVDQLGLKESEDAPFVIEID